ncbi:MAG TPA: alpha/beta hydrolase [Steroidobacteraceae bacterium]|nr:alpha/beta hydrolase [Steroidobacteraceae bacterium]
MIAAHPTAAGLAAAAASDAQPPIATSLRMGQLTLHRCETTAPWCGVLERPLDPTGTVHGTVPIYFEYFPHTAAGASTAGTVVTTEGGPGFPATESRDEYLTLLQPLRSNHDLLIMDNRGTGRSGAVDCQELQNAPALTEANIGACGRSLGSAAPLYSTTLATDDLAALLDALSIRSVDLYGDSYGTYFAQIFALRHAERLHSLVLDGAYPLNGPDYGWYPHYAPAMRAKFNLACERDPACKALTGSSLEHIAPTLALLRAKPFSARVHYGDGRAIRLAVNATSLAIVMFGSSPAYATVRELDAAARAFQGGDRLPLLRLMAETLSSVDSRDATHSPLQYSAGLAAAVSCQDPPQIVDMRLTPQRRLPVRDLEIRKREDQFPNTYAPFTIDEYRRMPLDYAFIDQCMRWPAPPPGAASPPLVSGAGPYPDIPVLVISGELDNMTSVADGTAAAARFPKSHHVVIFNSFHVNALPHARSECGAILARRFMENLETGDESCATTVPAIRLLPRFALHVAELEPAHASVGNSGGEYQLRVVTAALLTSEDVIERVDANGAGGGIGLRGGSFVAEAASPGYRIQLRNVRWTEDLSVSGHIDWAGHSGAAKANLELQATHGAGGNLNLQWSEGVSDGFATARGELDGKEIIADALAP